MRLTAKSKNGYTFYCNSTNTHKHTHKCKEACAHITPRNTSTHTLHAGFPRGSVSKESACYAGDLCSIPGSGRFPGEGSSNPLQYSCLENPMEGGTGQATVHRVMRVRHDLATREIPYTSVVSNIYPFVKANSTH